MELIPMRQAWHHFDELLGLHYQQWGHLRPAETLAQRRTRLLAQACAEPPIPWLLIAVDGDQLLGSAMLVERDGLQLGGDLGPWLAGVYVKLDARRRGVAARLIAAVETYAASLGHPRLHLCTEDQAGYYHRLGYRLIQTRNEASGAVHIMHKSLDGAPLDTLAE